MPYTALYRKFRPLRFEDMVGEEHITKTLENQIISNKVGHAYLFCGGRGTGKTTAAKILARAVNCLNPQNGEPCNECEMCKSILDGSMTDVIEMDAASNNSVDDIREIRDEVNFLPTKAKYRVYIIDEVHMLTTGAFNALLKTLEEPPEHVKFILATTEPQKLPTTILSRCQRFDFKKIPDSDIIKRLKFICDESKIKINDEALNLIAVLAEGAMRDAISILERCSQENSKEIDANLVKELVGIPSLEHIAGITDAILKCDCTKALEITDNVINEGKDLYNFLWEIIKYLKDVLVYKSTKTLSTYSKDELKKIDTISKLASNEKLLNIIYSLSSLENDIKWSSQKTIMFQTGIIKACLDVKNDGLDELKARVEKLENKINSEEYVKLPESNIKDVKLDLKGKTLDEKPKQNKKEVKVENDKIVKTKKTESKVDFDWPTIVNDLKGSGKLTLFTSLVNTTVTQIGDLVVEINFPKGLTPFVEKILDDPANKKEIENALFNETGKEWTVKIKKDSGNKKPSNAKENTDLDINVIE